jgi:hypothetical protein
MYSEISESSFSSLFSASSSRRENLLAFSDDDYGSGSDTVTGASTCIPAISSSSITLAFDGLLATSCADNLLSTSLSISTLASCASSTFIGSIPPFSRTSRLLGYSPFLSLTSSPFRRSNRRSFSVCSEDLALKTIISSPTPPRLKNLLSEKIYIAGWAVGQLSISSSSHLISLTQDKLRPCHTPEHIPWQFSEEEYEPMPWIPEGSLISRDRFYDIRRRSRPKSYSPPPSPACEDVSPAIDLLPLPSLIPESLSKRKLCLERSASCHGGSWRIRREALVIDGKVSVDKGYEKNLSSSQLPSSSSEPSNLDMLLKWQKMNSLHESGLEALKKSMMNLMEEQRFLNSPESLCEITVSSSSVVTSFSSGLDCQDPRLEQAQPILSLPLAVRRGQRVLSTIEAEQDAGLPPLSSPETPTLCRASPSGSTPVFESGTENKSADRISMEAAVMCERLRSMLMPIVSPYSSSTPSFLESSSVDSTPQQSFSLDGSTFVAEELEHAEIQQGEWAFAEDLYCGDPFSHFVHPNRVSQQHSRRLSVVPPSTHAQVSSNTANPSHSVSSLQRTGIPDIVISAGDWVEPGSLAHLSTSCEIPISSGRTGTPECLVMMDHSVDDTQSPESNREKSVVSRSSSSEPLRAFARSPMKRIQGILKPIKTVRFASSASEHVYPAEGSITVPTVRSRFPKRSSLRHQSSLRNECVVEATAVKSQNEDADPGFLRPSSSTPKKNRFSMIPLAGRLSPLVRASGAKQGGDTEWQPSSPAAKKNPFSMIPVTGRRPPLRPLDLKKPNVNNPSESPGRPPTPSPGESKKTIVKPKSHGSWTSNLRKYGTNRESENEMRKWKLSSPTPNHRLVTSAVKQGVSKSPDATTVKKPSPSTKLASPIKENPTRRGLSAADSQVDNKSVVKLKSGAGTGSIVPPRASSAVPRVIGKDYIGDRSLRDSFERHKIPAHLRTILGRLTG